MTAFWKGCKFVNGIVDSVKKKKHVLSSSLAKESVDIFVSTALDTVETKLPKKGFLCLIALF